MPLLAPLLAQRHCCPDAAADQFGNGPRTTTTTTKSPNLQRTAATTTTAQTRL